MKAIEIRSKTDKSGHQKIWILRQDLAVGGG